MNKLRGFTIVEFLVVTVVIASIGLVIVGILTSSLRSTNKTNIVNIVRVNGNGAIIQMTRAIEYAENFEGVSLDGVTYKTDCTQVVVPTSTPTPTPTQYTFVKITAFDGGQVIFSCTSPPDPTPQAIASNSASLIDINAVSVVPGKCWFTCNQDRVTSNPIIGISFQLQQTLKSPFAEKTASIPFETSVTFRNLGK